jgi:D-alanine-D-alanine ligase
MPDMPDYVVRILYRLPGEQPYCEFQQPHEADEAVQLVDNGLRAAGFETQIILVGDDIEQVLSSADPHKTVIFNYCEGYHENNSGYDPITQLYEALNLAYTGADDRNLWLSQDKANAKSQLQRHGVPTPTCCIFDNSHIGNWRIFPAFVKPSRLHASIGILPESVVETPAQLRQQVERVLDELGQPALVEDFIEGDEYRVTVWGNHELDVLPLARFHFHPGAGRTYGFKDFTTKWEETGLSYELPAKISSNLQRRIEKIAKAAFRAVGARDYGAVDIRVRGDLPHVIDANHNPDISAETCFILAIRHMGFDYDLLAGRIVRLAAERRPR